MPKPSIGVSFQHALTALKVRGLLLQTDSQLPSVAKIVVGKQIRGSWWSHPKGLEIYQVARRLASHQDVLVTKLVSGKVTFIHRKLWPAIFTIVSMRHSWQLDGLSHSALQLLGKIDKASSVRTDRLQMKTSTKIGDAARELEAKLLVHSQEIHTETGAHAKILETWKSWKKRNAFAVEKITVRNAQRRLEKAATALDTQHSGTINLPWGKRKKLR